jgi:orotate phosphoribosyltransferase
VQTVSRDSPLRLLAHTDDYYHADCAGRDQLEVGKTLKWPRATVSYRQTSGDSVVAELARVHVLPSFEDTALDRSTLARAIREVAYLTGTFRLRSGQNSSFYWDKYRFESEPELLRAIASELARLLPADGFDRLAGLELGGIPLATALSLAVGKPCVFVRKKAKDYGTCKLVEGSYTKGERIVVVEDVITTAGQVVESVTQMRDVGLVIDCVLCVIDRQQGGREKLAAIGCELHSVFTLAELEQLAAQA